MPLHDAIIWMDARGADDVKAAVGGPVRVQGYDPRKLRTLIKLTGGAPALSGKDPIAHILWFRREHPEIARATWKYLEPKDWLNLKLTGRCAATYDSIVLHWITDNRDLARIDYDPGLLRSFGVDALAASRSRARDVGARTAARTTIAAELGVPAGIPVVGGTPDLQSAAVGSGRGARLRGPSLRRHVVVAHVPRAVQEDRPVPRRRVAAVAAARQVLRGRRAGGRRREPQLAPRQRVLPRRRAARIAAARRFLPAASTTSPAARRPGSNGVIFTPWLNGERTPVDDHRLRGGWHDLSLQTTRADLVRSVLEGVAYNSRWLLGLRREVHGQAVPRAQLHRWGSAVATVVPDHGRRARPPDPPGGAPDPRQRRRRGRARGARARADDDRRHRPQRRDRRDVPSRPCGPARSTTSSSASSARSTSRPRASTRGCTPMPIARRHPTTDRRRAVPMRGWGLPVPGELDRVVIVSPHLDDAVLGCANFMAAHPGVAVVTVFAGQPARVPDGSDAQVGRAVGLRARRRRDGGPPARGRAPRSICSTRSRCISSSSSTPTTPATARSRPTCSSTRSAPALARARPDARDRAVRAREPRPRRHAPRVHVGARPPRRRRVLVVLRGQRLQAHPGHARVARRRRCSAAGSGRRRCARSPTSPRVRKQAAIACYPTQLLALEDDWAIGAKLAAPGARAVLAARAAARRLGTHRRGLTREAAPPPKANADSRWC